MEFYDFELVWMTSGTRGTPHAEALAESNPWLVWHVFTAPETGVDGWRNCDRNIRDWWRARGGTVTAERVLFLEWDVLVTCDLRSIFPAARNYPGIEGASRKMPVADGRSFKPFEEADKFPRPMQSYACGIAPLAVVMISAEALDAVCSPAFDETFAADIFSEIRLPTIIRWCGHEAWGNAALVQVGCGPIAAGQITGPGIYHAVKTGGAG